MHGAQKKKNQHMHGVPKTASLDNKKNTETQPKMVKHRSLQNSNFIWSISPPSDFKDLAPLPGTSRWIPGCQISGCFNNFLKL